MDLIAAKKSFDSLHSSAKSSQLPDANIPYLRESKTPNEGSNSHDASPKHSPHFTSEAATTASIARAKTQEATQSLATLATPKSTATLAAPKSTVTSPSHPTLEAMNAIDALGSRRRQSMTPVEARRYAKAEQAMREAEVVFETLNEQLLAELPAFYQTRVGLYGTLLRGVFSAEFRFLQDYSTVCSTMLQQADTLEKLLDVLGNAVFSPRLMTIF